jgi:hypothetical protein
MPNIRVLFAYHLATLKILLLAQHLFHLFYSPWRTNRVNYGMAVRADWAKVFLWINSHLFAPTGKRLYVMNVNETNNLRAINVRK